MSSDHQSQPDHALDRWLTTAMASLNAGLDGILDLDAGLADAQLPGLGDKLVHALDDVIDVDAGLSHIVDGVAPVAVRADRPAAANGLSGFANAFAVRPPHERLATRTWFPLSALRALRSSAHRATRALDLIAALADARTHAEQVGHAADLSQAGELDLAHDICRAVARSLDLDLARAVNAAGDLRLNLNFNRARECARNLDLAIELFVGIPHGFVGNFVSDLTSDLTNAHTNHRETRFIDRELARALDLASEIASTREVVARFKVVPGVVLRNFGLAADLVHALDFDGAIALDFVRALAIVLDLADARADDVDRARNSISGLSLGQAVVTAVDRLDEALTSMAGADLTGADLRSIPLEGVRWSHATRWPPGWEERIRHDSIVIEPGLYEIRPGGRTDANADSPTSTPA